MENKIESKIDWEKQKKKKKRITHSHTIADARRNSMHQT